MMNRRQLLTTVAAPAIAAAKGRQANLLVIMTDQHQRDASGCYGSPDAKTPHLDKLASRGIRFTRAYCTAPVCVPARGSIVTGLYPHTHGARTLDDPLPASTKTVGHFFKERGYVTGAIGKMHFVDENRRHGFDHRVHVDDFNRTLSETDRAQLRRDQGNAESVQGRPSNLPARYFQDNFYADETIRFLRENRNRPFCLWSSFIMPHTPLAPMRAFWDIYNPPQLTLPRRTETDLQDGFPGHLIRARERGWYDQSDDELRLSLTGYYGNLSQADRCIGRVYDALRELGLDRNTLVVYTSDHGEMAGAHRMWTKHNMYEQSIGVPLIVSLPERIPRGGSRHQLVSQVDLFPTVAALCGHEVPAGLHGQNLTATVTDNRRPFREFVYAEYYFCRNVFTRDNRYVGKPPIRMIRTDRWKLNHLEWDRSELFDLKTDPGEFRNRIDDRGSSSVKRELTEMVLRLSKS
jgi:choline-sulfatase